MKALARNQPPFCNQIPRSLCQHPTSHIPHRKLRRMTAPRAQGTSNVDASVATWIEENLDAGPVTNAKFAGGSSWSSCYIYHTSSNRSFFVKMALGRSAAQMFEGEALGLKAMHATHTLRVPEVFYYGDLSSASRPPSGSALRGGGSFIVMEHLNMRGSADPAKLGKQLALMHLAEPSADMPEAKNGQFGFAVDNTIGGTPQPNGWTDNWVDFYREKRLKHQLNLAEDAQLSKMGAILCDNLESLFQGIEVKPSVLHGDAWSGNITSVDGEPCVFDPATYYGHHEAEFGMSWCAGFSGTFWTAYHSVLPKAPGWTDRHDLYTLYHYLNHYNLFGGSYYNSCLQILQRLTKKM